MDRFDARRLLRRIRRRKSIPRAHDIETILALAFAVVAIVVVLVLG